MMWHGREGAGVARNEERRRKEGRRRQGREGIVIVGIAADEEGAGEEAEG